MKTPECQLEEQFIEKLSALKYEYRPDIRDRATLEQNFRKKFEALNRVKLTESEFPRLLEETITPDERHLRIIPALEGHIHRSPGQRPGLMNKTNLCPRGALQGYGTNGALVL